MDNQALADRYQALSPEYQEYIQSGIVEDIVQTLGKEENFNEDQTTVFTNGLVLYFLFVLDFDEFVSFIQRECFVSEEKARQLAGAVLVVLPEGFAFAQQKNYEALIESDNSNSQPEAAAETPPTPPTKPTDETPGIRTMADDMHQAEHTPAEENTYTSTQSAILREGTGQ